MEGGSDELEKVRGLCGDFEGWRRAIVLDPSASLGMTSCRDARAWMEWAGLKPAPTRRGVAHRGVHLRGSAPMCERMSWGWFLGRGTRLYSRFPVHSGVG